jgi:hypothetical protein
MRIEILVTPTRLLTKEEGDWAVAFAIPGGRTGDPAGRGHLFSPFQETAEGSRSRLRILSLLDHF